MSRRESYYLFEVKCPRTPIFFVDFNLYMSEIIHLRVKLWRNAMCLYIYFDFLSVKILK